MSKENTNRSTSTKQGKYVDLIVENRMLRDEIYRQFKSVGMSLSDLSKRTEYYGHKIDKSVLSGYFTANKKISQRDVIFLAKLFGISVELKVFKSEVNPNTIRENLKKLISTWKFQQE